MIYDMYSHRFADVILNSDYETKIEIEDVIRSVEFADVQYKFEEENLKRAELGKKLAQGRQSTINLMFREEFEKRGWEVEKNVFNDPDNDLTIDFWKRDVGVDIAFNHRSFIGGDLLRLQAGSEVKHVIKVGVYVCPTKAFAKIVSPRDGASMVNYERSKWYLESFFSVFTVPILLIGLKL